MTIILKTIEELDIIYEERTIKVTITIGLALYQNSGSLDDLIKEVDAKLYEGKKNGRNRVIY